MYNFSYFKENDKQVLLDFIEENPFAFMTGSGRKKQRIVFAGTYYAQYRPPQGFH
jgi:predicted FMN-binding regulatory protein PaiB